MHQTVFNTFKSLQLQDPSRFLELTNPGGIEQLKRMAIHNDIFLAFLAPFYFIHTGPETLLVLQTVAIASGIIPLFGITLIVLEKLKKKRRIAFILGLSYLLYSPLQYVNIYDFHAISFAIPFLLWMYFLWLKKNYYASIFFLILACLTYEQVALTGLFFGIFTLVAAKIKLLHVSKNTPYSLSVILFSVIWFAVSVFYIIPHFREVGHFALKYYGDIGDSTLQISIAFFKHPVSALSYLFRFDTLIYLSQLLFPLGFLSLLSPIHLLIALPEFAINLLSNNWYMRTITLQYSAVIIPFVFISAIYGILHFYRLYESKLSAKIMNYVPLLILIMAIGNAYWSGPLPYARKMDSYVLFFPQDQYKEANQWSQLLGNDEFKISSTEKLGPLFSGRRYFYIFGKNYYLADYVIIRPQDIEQAPDKELILPAYKAIQTDTRFTLLYNNENLKVYKKL